MRIECPRCNASYDLPPEKLPPGRGVRCVRCTQLWTPVPLAVAPAAAEPYPAPMPSAASGPRAPPRPPVAAASALQRMRLPGAWLLTVLVLAALAWAAVNRRAEIMHAWPPSERAYIALGLVPHP